MSSIKDRGEWRNSRGIHLNDSVTAGTYQWISILEPSPHLWLRMKQEDLDCDPEDWICMAPHSLLAAELTQPALLLSFLPPYQPSLSPSFPLLLGILGNLSGIYRTAFCIQNQVTVTLSHPPASHVLCSKPPVWGWFLPYSYVQFQWGNHAVSQLFFPTS